MSRKIPRSQFLCTALTVGFLLGSVVSSEIQADPGVTGKRVEFNEFSLELPSLDWTRVDEYISTHITFICKGEDQAYQCLGIWPEWVPLLKRGKSREWYISACFDRERHLTRTKGSWGGFVEGERTIEGRRYPTMSFHISDSIEQPEKFLAAGLFLLIFPQDFETRHIFYILMWVDSYPTLAKGKGLNELDKIVSSFQPPPR